MGDRDGEEEEILRNAETRELREKYKAESDVRWKAAMPSYMHSQLLAS